MLPVRLNSSAPDSLPARLPNDAIKAASYPNVLTLNFEALPQVRGGTMTGYESPVIPSEGDELIITFGNADGSINSIKKYEFYEPRFGISILPGRVGMSLILSDVDLTTFTSDFAGTIATHSGMYGFYAMVDDEDYTIAIVVNDECRTILDCTFTDKSGTNWVSAELSRV